MKKVLTGLTIAALLIGGVAVYAQGPGWGWGHSYPGYGSHMMGPGYGGHMMGWRGGFDQKYLDETVDVRKELNTKRFEYYEAIRNQKTTPETITKLEKEIGELQEKLYAKAPRSNYGGFGMPCWQY